MSKKRDSGSKASGPKVLRIGIVQRGKIIEEREVKKRETVSIGTSSRCTFQVTSDALPKSFDLFEFDGKSYYLRFDEGIEGRVQLDDEQVADFKALASRGLVVQRSGKKAVRLTERSRGKVMVGDITVLFQFKVVTPAPVRPVLPPDVRGSFFQNIDTQFATIFIIVALFQISFLGYARSLPYVEPTSIEELSEEYQRLIMPDRVPEPPREVLAEVSEPQKDEGKKEEEKPKKKPVKKPKKKASTDDPAKAAKARRDAARAKVAKTGLLKVLGAKRDGGAGGALSDVFSEGSESGSLDAAFSGIQGVDIAENAGQSGTRGGGSGAPVGVGNLGTQGGGSVSTGRKREARVVGKLKEETPEIDGSMDADALRRVIRRKQSGIKACYNNALKRNPKLAGKLILRFEIDESGRVQNSSFGGTLNSKEVESCVRRRMRSWRFPRTGEINFVEIPFVLTASG